MINKQSKLERAIVLHKLTVANNIKEIMNPRSKIKWGQYPEDGTLQEQRFSAIQIEIDSMNYKIKGLKQKFKIFTEQRQAH